MKYCTFLESFVLLVLLEWDFFFLGEKLYWPGKSKKRWNFHYHFITALQLGRLIIFVHDKNLRSTWDRLTESRLFHEVIFEAIHSCSVGANSPPGRPES